MKKILVLINSLGGLYSFRRELIHKLIEEQYEVIIAAPENEKKSYFIEIGCSYINIPIERRGTNPVTDFKLLMKYKKIISNVRPSVVLTYTIKPNVYGGLVCRLLGVPYISNITGLGTAVENNSVLQKITLSLYKIGLKKSSCIFFQNRENMKFMLDKNVVNTECKLIPGSGVNLEHYKLLEYPNEDIIHFLFISRIMKEKGIDQYLDAARYIKSKYDNIVFDVLGNSEELYRVKLEKMQNEGLIVYHGRQEDVREFHKLSHCTIHPTYYPEGMSNVLLESAACGRPIITTNRSGCREIIEDGVNGFIVEQKNSKDLIEKIEKFLRLSFEEKRQMGSDGRKKVEKEFDRQIVIKAYLDEIDKLLYR